MASTAEHMLLDFDLNLLNQTNSEVVQNKINKQQKAILITKRKIIATDSLIKKYYDKKEIFEQTERSLVSSKEECKQICLEYKNNLDKIINLEQETHHLRTLNKNLETKSFALENKLAAANSHAYQLQTLVKEYETLIESLKIEKQMEKQHSKDQDKKILSLEKMNEILGNHLSLVKDVVLGKAKLNDEHKNILRKYGNSSDKSKLDELCDKDSDNDDVFDDHMSPLHDIEMNINLSPKTTSIFDEVQMKHSVKEKLINNDSDSDCSNGIVSVDTGRGSSLAFSDGEKCFNSPESYLSEISDKKQTLLKVNRSTSPIEFDQHSLIIEETKIKTPAIIVKDTSDKANSPIMWAKLINSMTSPIKYSYKEMATSPIKQVSRTNVQKLKQIRLLPKDLSDYSTINIPPLYDDNSDDCEVETILHSMRFSHDLITPLPPSPSRSRTDNATPYRQSTLEHGDGYSCLEAAKVREDYKNLQSCMKDLVNEVMSIKTLLQKSSKTRNGDNLVTINPMEEQSAAIPTQQSQKSVNKTTPTRDQQVIPQILFDNPNSPVTIDEPFIEANKDEEVNASEILCSSHSLTNPEVVMSRLQFEDPVIENSQNLDLASKKNDERESIHKSINHESIVLNKRKSKKKLSKLQKMKKILLPKCKIKRLKPVKKLRCKKLAGTKVSCIAKKQVTEADSALTLNDKSVYEKAKKVLLEMKSAQKPYSKVFKSVNNKPKRTNVFGDNKDISETKKSGEIGGCRSKGNRLKSADNITKQTNIFGEIIDTSEEKESRERRESVPKDNQCVENDSGRCTRSRKRIVDVDKVTTTFMGKIQPVIKCEKLLTSGNVVIQSPENRINKTEIATGSKRKHKDSISESSEEMSHKRTLRSSTAKKILEDDASKQMIKCASVTIDNTTKNESAKSMIFGDHCSKAKANNYLLKTNIPASGASDTQISFLCRAFEKYGLKKVKHSAKKIPDSVINNYCKKLESGIKHITELKPNQTKKASKELVNEVEKWQIKHFLASLLQYLMHPDRKTELFNKENVPPAPPMTKSEQVVLYILTELTNCWPQVDLVDMVLTNIEYALFKLNRTPTFDVVESMSHFYAVLCRYHKAKSRLRLFVLDAMYCIQFKALPLIKQCMEVWMHILPLANMSIANSSLVMCMVYLMHFYKCEDRFNRVQEVRNLLSRKYYYNMSTWSEKKILALFSNAIRELQDNPVEAKMLRIAIITLAKRHGPKWCQKHIIKDMLQPILDDHTVPARIRKFCILMIGPLLKPYPNEMKVHCELAIDQLNDLLVKKPSEDMVEAIYTSLIYLSKHNLNRILAILLQWKPEKISPEIESILRDFVRSKPIKVWQIILSKIVLSDSNLI